MRVAHVAPQKEERLLSFLFLLYTEKRKGFLGGRRFARVKRFAARKRNFRKRKNAKATIDNCRTGRAAKKANPFLFIIQK